MNELRELFKKSTILEETRRLNKIIDKSNDLLEINECNERLDKIRDYSVSLLKSIKRGNDESFDELIEIKDMRNFIYYNTFKISKRYNNRCDEEYIVNEIKFRIFYQIKTNYRIYNKFNEISLLINSMRRWIIQSTVSSMYEDVFP